MSLPRGARHLGLLILALVLLTGRPAAQASDAPRMIVDVKPRTGEVGLVMTVTLKVTGSEAADCELVQIPEMDGVRLDLRDGPSHSQSTYIVNNKMTRYIETETRSWE